MSQNFREDAAKIHAGRRRRLIKKHPSPSGKRCDFSACPARGSVGFLQNRHRDLGLVFAALRPPALGFARRQRCQTRRPPLLARGVCADLLTAARADVAGFQISSFHWFSLSCFFPVPGLCYFADVLKKPPSRGAGVGCFYRIIRLAFSNSTILRSFLRIALRSFHLRRAFRMAFSMVGLLSFVAFGTSAFTVPSCSGPFPCQHL